MLSLFPAPGCFRRRNVRQFTCPESVGKSIKPVNIGYNSCTIVTVGRSAAIPLTTRTESLDTATVPELRQHCPNSEIFQLFNSWLRPWCAVELTARNPCRIRACKMTTPNDLKKCHIFADSLLTCCLCGGYMRLTDEGGSPLAVLPFALV